MKYMTSACPFNRRTALALGAARPAAGGFLVGCSPQTPTFKITYITGATFAEDLKLTDHTGQLCTMADSRGKAVMVFFGFTQCPHVCPTTMTTMAGVRRLMGDQGKLKIYFRKAEVTTPTSYTMDHSAGKYVFDTDGQVRLLSSYGTEPGVIAEDILTLLKSMEC